MPLPPQSLQAAVPRSSIWIKICGMTTADGIEAAVAAGVDAVGFVFYPLSKRSIAPHEAARLAARVPAGILKFAVMLHPAQTEVDEMLAGFQPDVLQTDHDDFERLQLPSTLVMLPVVRSGRPLPPALPQRLLFEGPVSGTGATTDWSGALPLARRCELILAGGLHSGNVGAAIASVRPFGVDVSSGVERAPGIKDPVRIHAFVQAARRGPAGESVQ